MNRLTNFLTATLVLATIPSQPVAQDIADYKLGSGDLISIQVFSEDDLSMEVRLSGTASISYPFLGELTVANNTVLDLEKQIADGLRGDYLIEPRVNVSVVEYRPFFITGEVKDPGSYPFIPGLTLRKAITLAGGFTERASRNKIYVTNKDAYEAGNRTGKTLRMDDPIRPDDVITIEQSFF